MKQHRNVGTVRIVYAQLFAAALLVVSCLAISWLTNRIATAQVYGMTDKLYVVNSFIGAFDRCEKAVYDYRWIESWEDGPARAELVRNNMADMDTYLKEMTRGFTAADGSLYHDSRALQNMLPHYFDFVNSFLALMERGDRNEAIAVYYQKENLVTLIRSYSTTFMLDRVQASQAEYSLTQERIDLLWLLQAFICVLALLLVGYFAFSLTNILSPIGKLVEASKAMGRENFDIPDIETNTRNREILQLVDAFNQMKHSANQLINTLMEHNRTLALLHQTEAKVLESQKLAEEAKLQSLRSQINPHFLFNTLNTICRVARLEKAAKTEGLILSLSKVFRHSLRSDTSPTTLADEMSVTREYFKIQQTRFGERMQLDWRISSQCDPEELLVPPFILETMVENAVKHGLEPKPQGGLVRVRIYMKEEILHLIVVDNGCGISPETLEYIHRGEKPPQADHGIGIHNVSRRLKLLGKGNQLRVQSKLGLGTKVSMEIPATYREEEP